MPVSILATKLHMPSVREALVLRPDLVERLNDGLTRKMSLISAPAGYGKTTLVVEWLQSLRGVRQEAAAPEIGWLSLDEADGDPARFLVHVVAALSRAVDSGGSIGEETLAMLQILDSQSVETVHTSLINDLSSIEPRIILVLEDYHVIDSSAVDRIVIFLIEHLPASLHVVVTTRSDPSLSLSRLRARGELSELRAGDLRFSIEEAKHFLNMVMKLDLAPESVAALARRTEGWVAGLQLAALSMQRNADVEGFVRSFTGSSRYVMDYLLEEVLNRQPEGVKEFLLQTSILERLTASLCDALTGRNDGQSILESLEHDNLFVISLDEERHWYRYHHLFAELLRRKLIQSQNEEVPSLHHRAGTWYEQRRLVTEALPHIFATGELLWAARMVEEVGDRTIWEQSDVILLRHWLERMPDDLIRSRPGLSILSAWVMWASGQAEQVETYLQSAESALNETQCESELWAQVVELRGMLATLDGNLHRAIELLKEARRLVPSSGSHLAAVTPFFLAEAHFMNGELLEAESLYRLAEKAGWKGNYHFIAALSARGIGLVQALEGALHDAMETYRTFEGKLETHDVHSPSGQGIVGVGIGEILCEWNELDRAIDMLTEGIEHARRSARPRPILPGYAALSRARRGLGDLDGARRVIEDAVELSERYHVHPMWNVPPAAVHRVRFLLACGNVAAARAWVEQEQILGGQLTALSEIHNITMARVLLAEDSPIEALELLTRLIEFTRTNGRISSEIEISILQALAHDCLTETDVAIERLQHALELAEPGGFVRIFLDEGPPLARLLYEAASRGMACDHLRKLLIAFPPAESAETERLQVETANTDLFEPLSDRELDVLRLIAEGLTSQEIGEKLFISPHTAKSHSRNLFAKLEVHSRTAAVNKARGLGLLPHN
jgi:LuxR family transcriptional regulator, maltose regulon positive regulatory protein